MSRRGFAYRLLAAIALVVLTLLIGQRPGLEVSEVIAGLAAAAAAIAAVEAGIRAYRITLGVHARPKIARTVLPEETSQAFGPLVRLAARERELAEHVIALPGAVSADTWRQASAAAKALRTHGSRIVAVEKRAASGHAPTDVALLASRLREGVSAYERLTATAAELAVHDGDGTPPKNAALRLADAADALVGVTRALSS